MKPAKSIRECRIIKNGAVIFEGPDEKCLAFLLRLKNRVKPRRVFRNSSLLKTEPKGHRLFLQ
jgi:hypothetical protein